PTPTSSSSTPSGGRRSPRRPTTRSATTRSTRGRRSSARPSSSSCAATSSSRTASSPPRRASAGSCRARGSASRSPSSRSPRVSPLSRAFFTSHEENDATVMSVVGSPKAPCRGRLRPLAVLLILLAALPLGGTAAGSSSTRAKGIDISNNNGAINWAKVAGAGYRFAFGKATEGTTFTDGTYSTNRNASESAGLVFGAYHFARPSGTTAAAATASAVAQADYFLSVAQPQPGELPPVLDLEKTGNLSPTLLTAWTQAWVDEVYSRLGVEPFVYSSPAF